jgi:hemerythrin
MNNLLIGLEKYAENHFKTEEKYFKEIKFPAMAEHIQSHQLYKEKIKELRKRHDVGSNITYTLMTFLRTWWSQHILKEDKAYVSSVKELINSRMV